MPEKETKIDFIIEKQLPRLIMKYKKCLEMKYVYPLPFHATQTINPFLTSRISVNYDIVDVHSANIIVNSL